MRFLNLKGVKLFKVTALIILAHRTPILCNFFRHMPPSQTVQPVGMISPAGSLIMHLKMDLCDQGKSVHS